jgi:hypothetical protein
MDIISMSLSYPLVEVLTRRPLEEFLDSCPPTRDLYIERTNWLSISILLLSVLNGVLQNIACNCNDTAYIGTSHPIWWLSHSCHSIHHLYTPCKTIELFFITVFIAFLGQVLSRQSLIKASRGVTIAELTLRTWVIQARIYDHSIQYLRHAALSFLGCGTLIVALICMVYTTAFDALVFPHLCFGH